MASKNSQAMVIAIIAGILLLIAGVSGFAAWEAIKDFVTTNVIDNSVVQIVFAILIFIASLGGIAVIAGGLLLGKNKVGTGKFLITLGAGLGLIGLIFSIQTEAVSSNQECQWVSVDQNSIAGILTMIGERVRENHNKLSTWQGKIKIVTDRIDRGAIAERTFRERLKDDGQPTPNTIVEHQEFFREFGGDLS